MRLGNSNDRTNEAVDDRKARERENDWDIDKE